MRLSFIFSILACATAWAGPDSFPFKSGDTVLGKVTGLSQPVTLQVTNFNGLIYLKAGKPECTEIRVTAEGISIPEGEMATLEVDSPEGEVVTVNVRYPTPKRVIEVHSMELGPDGISRSTRSTESSAVSLGGNGINPLKAQGSSKLTIEIPARFLGNTMIVTQAATVTAKGFPSVPPSMSERILWLMAPEQFQLGELDLYYSELWTADALDRCNELLLDFEENEPQDRDKIFPYPFPDRFVYPQ